MTFAKEKITTALPSGYANEFEFCGSMPFPMAVIDRDGEILISSPSFKDLADAGYSGARVGTAADMIRKKLEQCAAAQHASGFDVTVNEAFSLRLMPSVSPSGYWIACQHSTQTFGEELDALTGIANRVALRRELKHCLKDPLTAEQSALLLLDLDRFKAVNDTLGHPIGDELLKMVVQRLQKVVGSKGLLVRLGGDEFAILVRGANDPTVAAATMAEQLIDLVGRSYLVSDHLVTIGLSVGIALARDAELDPDRLLILADLALYSAKANGRGRHRFFEAHLEDRARERRSIEQDMRRALVMRQFEVFYQPQVAADDHRILGFEALVRWRHPEKGMILPASFIPIAEESGLIVQIGEWVLRTACREAVSWPNDIVVAVNLSPIQILHPGLVATVTHALAASGLPADRLELEITEAVMLQDSVATIETLMQLKALGVRIAMDDFGTAYSSLSYLRSFPFDKVKIDQSFVREMSINTDAMAIVRAVLGLGISLGMAVTAEGVETEDQLTELRAEGCGELQGYLISRPIPAGAIAALLTTTCKE